MSKSELETYCTGDSNSNLDIFGMDMKSVSKYGNPELDNIDDFVNITETNAATLASYSDNACTLSNILAYNFYVLETGSIKNP